MRLWGPKSEIDTLKAWVAAVNSRDFTAVASLTADGFTFVDSSGTALSGKNECMSLLQNLFKEAPDHRIRVDSFTKRGDEILMTGVTQASNSLHATSTLFCAKVEGERLARWQSYSDKPTQTLAHFAPTVTEGRSSPKG